MENCCLRDDISRSTPPFLRLACRCRLPVERRPHGRGFRYLIGDKPVDHELRERIEALAVPPAWVDVRIAATDRPHILAMGVDDAGRTQYRYHERFRAEADRLKFARLHDVGKRLARLRRNTSDALADDHDHRDIAAVIGLIDLTAIRVGSKRYAEEHGTIGASTLQRRHVDVDDPLIHLAFTAKGGIDRDLAFEQRELAEFLDAVADHLGNTRAVARSSYVAPSVVAAFEDGRLDDAWSRSRRSTTYSRAEQTLRKVLTD